MKFFDRPFVLPALMIGLSFLAGLTVVGWGISARNQQNTINVAGSASQNATADKASWTINLSGLVNDATQIDSGSKLMTKSLNAVSKYLANKKLSGAVISISPASVNSNTNSNNDIVSYSINGSVTLSTSDVDSVSSLYQDTGNLNGIVAKGIIVLPQQPEYLISNLPSFRVSLLGSAIKDAKARAEQIAKSGGSTVGALETASSGVIQVLPPDSENQQGEYGDYDTSTIQKVVTVTLHASFYVH